MLRGASPGVAVRDSKDPDGPMLAFGPADWWVLSSGIKWGAFDLELPNLRTGDLSALPALPAGVLWSLMVAAVFLSK